MSQQIRRFSSATSSASASVPVGWITLWRRLSLRCFRLQRRQCPSGHSGTLFVIHAACCTLSRTSVVTNSVGSLRSALFISGSFFWTSYFSSIQSINVQIEDENDQKRYLFGIIFWSFLFDCE
jgi:hypothetical protein